MAKQDFTAGQILTAAQMDTLQANDYNWTVSAKTASYTLAAADAGTVIQMNSASSTTITVNTSLFTAGDIVKIYNIGAGTCTVTAGTATVNTSGSLALAQYGGGTLYAQSASSFIFFPFGGVITPIVEYVVVAGGGGGGTGGTGISGGGGGGAGGYRSSVQGENSGAATTAELRLIPVSGTSYTVTVGAGGAATANGSNSVFATVTALGGGGGGTTAGNGLAGGSGGGSSGRGDSTQRYGGAATTVVIQPTVQGTAGANSYGAGLGTAGGGGGAGATTTTINGGNGIQSSITGTATYRGGGGGGEGSSTGGQGGGANGATAGNVTAPSGTANTGGGGGGGGSAGGAGGSGGSGVVIVRTLSSAPIATTTGSPTVSTSGLYRIYTFNASGTITWTY